MYKFAIAIIICVVFIIGLILAVNQPDRPSNANQNTTDRLVGRWPIGSESSPIRIIEFADFECPACAAAAPILNEVINKYGDKISLSFVHYSLPQHKRAMAAANAAEAAGEQGKFWAMAEILFARQLEWTTVDDFKPTFGRYSLQIGVDPSKILSAIGVGQYTQDRIDKDYLLGQKVGVNSTPTFMVNGQIYRGMLRLNYWEEIIQKRLSEVDGQLK